MKANTKSITKLFMCVTVDSLEIKKILCSSELNKNTWFFSPNKIPGDYQIQYIAAKNQQEASSFAAAVLEGGYSVTDMFIFIQNRGSETLEVIEVGSQDES